MLNDIVTEDDQDFEDAVDLGWIAPTFYGWFENSYVTIDRLMPFDGYWINTSRTLTLKIRPHLFENGELTRKSENVAATSILELRARDIAGDGISDFVTVGLLEDADDEFVYGEDEYDLPQQAYTSMGGEYIDMKVGADLMKDIKSTEYDDFHAWNISINTDKVDNNIELSWGDVSGFEDDLHIVINGEAIDMHGDDTSIEISSNMHEITVVVGDVDLYLNPIPEEFGLSAAYPNPFNPTTNLGLALNEEGFVSMSVFNIRGQVVEVLVDHSMKAGYHNIKWNADGVSSGMYFVRVKTGVNTAIQKVMLIK
jgi:GTPase SAR1 family protein